MTLKDAVTRKSRGDGGDKGLGTELGELMSMVLAYAKQETILPLKDLVRFVAFGVAGALLIAAGGAVATLAAVRVIQTETGPHLHGDLTWVPYFGGVIIAAIGASWAALRISRKVK